jgi:hypothetical protein
MKKIRNITIILCILLSGCTFRNGVTTSPTAFSTQVIQPSSAPTATLDLISTPTLENTYRTPVPTLSINVEQKMVEVLKSNDCNLPCYMGVIPGETKWSDAKILLETLGANFEAQGLQGDGKWYSYIATIDDPSITMTNGAVEDHRISNSIGLIIKNDVVQRTYIWILGRGLSPKFQDYWSKYSPKGVFLQLGIPDEIYSAGGLLALEYKRLGIINTYDTFWLDGQLCPQNETGHFDRRFVIKNKNTSDALFTEFQDSLRNKALWDPIEESLGISVKEFYDQVIADDSVCFDIKIR